MLASSCEDTFDWEAASSCGVPHSWMNGSAGVPAVPATISMSVYTNVNNCTVNSKLPGQTLALVLSHHNILKNLELCSESIRSLLWESFHFNQ
jgi:hypothetical protein